MNDAGKIEVEIEHNGTVYRPNIKDGIDVCFYRCMTPSKAIFSVCKDELIDFAEGDKVRITIDGSGFFAGRIFIKKRDKNEIISVTAYDNLRYLKNKGIYTFTGKSLADIVKTISGDMLLETGKIEGTPYILGGIIAENKTMFDIIQGAIDETYEKTGKLYVLRDDYGKIVLESCGENEIDYKISDETAENFEYSSSIDKNVYNQVSIRVRDKKNGNPEYFIKDSDLESRWGVLRYSKTALRNDDIKNDAQFILKNSGKVKRHLKIKGAFGDTRIKSGSAVYVDTEKTGDVLAKGKYICEEVIHHFEKGGHKMDITLKGGVVND